MSDKEDKKNRRYAIEAAHVQRVLLCLVAAGRPFACDPLPEDQWQITVKAEDADTVRDVIANRVPVYFEDGEFRSLKHPAAEALWAAICADDVPGAAEIIRVRGDNAARVGNGVLLRCAVTRENEDMTRLLLGAGALPRDWWDDEEWDFVRRAKGAGPSEESSA